MDCKLEIWTRENCKSWIHWDKLGSKTAKSVHQGQSLSSTKTEQRQGGRCGESIQGDGEASCAARCHRDAEVHGTMDFQSACRHQNWKTTVKEGPFCHSLFLNILSYIESLALFCLYPPSFSVQFRLYLESLEDLCIVCLVHTQLRLALMGILALVKSTSHKIHQEAGRDR